MDPDLSLTSALPIPEGEGGAAGVSAGRLEVLARLRERIVAFAASRGAGAHAEDLAPEDLVLLAFQILRFKRAAHRRRAARRGEYDAVDLDAFPPPSDAPDPAMVLERKELLARLMGGS